MSGGGIDERWKAHQVSTIAGFHVAETNTHSVSSQSSQSWCAAVCEMVDDVDASSGAFVDALRCFYWLMPS
jgi:hypothetical protein